MEFLVRQEDPLLWLQLEQDLARHLQSLLEFQPLEAPQEGRHSWEVLDQLVLLQREPLQERLLVLVLA
jgi:hypothetical protein